jgi:hypothetical protein
LDTTRQGKEACEERFCIWKMGAKHFKNPYVAEEMETEPSRVRGFAARIEHAIMVRVAVLLADLLELGLREGFDILPRELDP